MTKCLETRCPKCGDEIEISQIHDDALAAMIEDERDDAASRARDEVESDAREDVEMEVLGSDRAFRELAAAIRQGDRREAEYQLDRIAERAGSEARNQVELGRYSIRARVA